MKVKLNLIFDNHNDNEDVDKHCCSSMLMNDQLVINSNQNQINQIIVLLLQDCFLH